jgi:hypothetical protein
MRCEQQFNYCDRQYPTIACSSLFNAALTMDSRPLLQIDPKSGREGCIRHSALPTGTSNISTKQSDSQKPQTENYLNNSRSFSIRRK